MKNIFVILSLILMLFSVCRVNAQVGNNNISDSLMRVLKDCKTDTCKVNALYTLGMISYENKNALNTEKYCREIIKILDKQKIDIRKADAYNLLGISFKERGFYELSLENYNKALDIYSLLKNEKGIVAAFNNISVIYNLQSNLEKAIEFQLKALEIKERGEDKKSISVSYNNMGNYYSDHEYYDKAEESYKKALLICQQIDDKKGSANAFNNIGINFMYQGNYEKAKEYFRLGLYIFMELGESANLSASYNNLAIIYGTEKLYDSALVYYNKAIEIEKARNDFSSEAEIMNNMAVIYSDMGDNKKALECLFVAKNSMIKADDNYSVAKILSSISLEYFYVGEYNNSLKYMNQSIEIAKERGFKDVLKDNYHDLADIFKQKGDFQKANEQLELYTLYKDTIFNEEKQKQILEMQTRFETEKKEKEIVILNKDNALKSEELRRKEEEIQNQYIINYSVIGGLLVITLFLLILFRLFIQKKRANTILKEQRKQIDDSINYARRIQHAVLPVLKNSLKTISSDESMFVIFRPKDVVSGDFYWATQTEDWTIITVADCTGHGVPGAFMSMLGVSFLNEIVRKKEVTTPAEILNHLRTYIMDALNQTGETGSQKDGMDMSIVAIHKDKRKIHWAGANNPLWIIRADAMKKINEEIDISELIEEIKADKMPVSIHVTMNDFINHEINIAKGDKIFMFSDGYPDQFGGPKGKKYMQKTLKRKLVESSIYNMKEQGQILEKEIDFWMNGYSNVHEQLDDITVIGIEIV